VHAIDVLTWPGMNQAFIFSFVVSTGLALLAIPYAKRRPAGTPVTWGEAMVGAVWAFGLMFIAFGIVPHQWIDHADKDLGWTKTKYIYGPFDILQPKALGGNFPFTLQYEAVRDVIVVVIHLWYFGLMLFLWSVWQNRGKKAAAKSTEIATSSYGRPLVKKA
jgi:hypothetical protein